MKTIPRWVKQTPEEIRPLVEQEYYVNPGLAKRFAACRTREEIYAIRRQVHELRFEGGSSSTIQLMIDIFADPPGEADGSRCSSVPVSQEMHEKLKHTPVLRIAKALGVSESTVKKYRKTGTVPEHRLESLEIFPGASYE